MNKLSLTIIDSNKIARKGLVEILSRADFIEIKEVLGSIEELSENNNSKLVVLDPYSEEYYYNSSKKQSKISSKMFFISDFKVSFKEIKEMQNHFIRGFLLKSSIDDVFPYILYSAQNYGFYLDYSIFNNREIVINKDKMSKKEFKDKHANLTQREFEVLKLIVDGNTNKQIADKLNVSNHTAKAHVGNIIQKFLVEDRTQAAVKAIKEGVI